MLLALVKNSWFTLVCAGGAHFAGCPLRVFRGFYPKNCWLHIFRPKLTKRFKRTHLTGLCRVLCFWLSVRYLRNQKKYVRSLNAGPLVCPPAFTVCQKRRFGCKNIHFSASSGLPFRRFGILLHGCFFSKNPNSRFVLAGRG